MITHVERCDVMALLSRQLFKINLDLHMKMTGRDMSVKKCLHISKK